jgi:hypothetical protein
MEGSMKLKALTIASFLMLASSAFAQFFSARTFVTVLPAQVTAEVFNPYYEPIICNGQVFGQTASGVVLNSFFNEQFMPAGSYRFAVVRANPLNPFVGGWANIHCRFARWW